MRNMLYLRPMSKSRCNVCGDELADPRSRHCVKHYRDSRRGKTLKQRFCRVCSTQLKPGKYKYCSIPCRKRAVALARNYAVCERAGCETKVNRRGARFCSRECMSLNAGSKPCVRCGTGVAKYGSKVCPDCVKARRRLKHRTVPMLDSDGRIKWS